MRHSPGVAPMTAHRSFRFVCVILEWVSCSGSFAYQRLIILWFVSSDFIVKHALADWPEIALFGAFEIFSVGSAFRFASHGIVMRFSHLLNQIASLASHASLSSTSSCLRKQPTHAT